ncbi:phage late control D family protein [Salmonella enterica subsp. enterica]|uniref:Phage late control D family protein n=1 Tax=Salmonella enterica I TaxID=59201 RepID=A0A5U3EP93_SALET|nr:phage late control D family protein [Salmonella enterica subsp. enterica]
MAFSDAAGQLYDRLTGYDVPQPAFTLEIADDTSGEKNASTNNANATTKIMASRLISLSLTDNRGFEADTLTVTLSDADGRLSLPRRGATLKLALGYRGQRLTDKGSYTVDEVEHSGAPDTLTITARSADFRDSLNVQREQSWHNLTLDDIARTVATRNKLKCRVAAPFASVSVDHSDQTNESDGSYLTRLGKQYGFAVSVKNGTLLLLEPGSNTTASGKPVPPVVITRQSGDSHSFRICDRDAYTGVIAHYLNTRNTGQQKVHVRRKQKQAEQQPVTTPPGHATGNRHQGDYMVGSDENLLVLRHTYANRGNAERAALSAWKRLQRGTASFSITLATGRPEITPEYPVRVQGFKPEIDSAKWTITRVTHTLNDSGLITGLEMEVSANDATAEDATREKG